MQRDDSAGPQDAARTPVTELLGAAADGDAAAAGRLFDLVYEQLHEIARSRMAGERAGHTLQPTALVNEAYLRLLGSAAAAWSGRGDFFRAAARAMRQILIDHARARGAEKRGGGRAALSISSLGDIAAGVDPAGFLALDDAIFRLEKVDAFAASVVRLRFFTGLEPDLVARTLGASERTVRRAWTFARGWLRDALENDLSEGRND